MVILIERDRRLLLVRRAIDPYRGWWDLPGGFLEENEHPREAAVREAREETGLRIAVGELSGVYLDRNGDVYTMNLVYRTRVLGGREQAGDDADALRWFAPRELPKRIAFPGHAREVLRAWVRGLRD